jgi:nucleotide-binding universal stress UspA family protein
VFTTIVVGTDGSANAEKALKAAADLASVMGDVSVHIVTAFHPLSASEMRDLADQLPAEFRPVLNPHGAAEQRLAGAHQIFSHANVEAEVHEIDGDPTDALLTTAEQVGADLIVVGSRGEGAAKRALHGSVSTKIVHHAPCAVLVVRD